MNRNEWFRWRQGGIGSSDAPIIMGVSPYKTALELYEEKVSEDLKETGNSFITDLGQRMEPRIRALYEMYSGKDFPAECVESADFPFLRASLDGRASDGEIIEIKLLGLADWTGAKAGVVPLKHWPQVQHQLLVSGAPQCVYVAYLYDKECKEELALSMEKLAFVVVKPDELYLGKLIEAEMQFWECVQKKKPPLPSAKDFKRLTGYVDLANQWAELDKKIKELEVEREKVRDLLIEAASAAKHPRLVCAGIRLSQQSRAGNVDYKKIPELRGVDLDQYRGKGSVFWKIEHVVKETVS